MGISHTTTLFHGNFDFTKATSEDVYFAFVIRMPFRFRVGSPFHCQFGTQAEKYDTWIRNKPIGATAPGTSLPLSHPGGKVEDLWSTAAVIPNKGKITPDEIAIIRASHGTVDKVAFESIHKCFFPAMQG